MIQSIYTSVNNADIVPCGKKGTIIKSEPIPLLRDNYLGEYRTQLEKAKVRKNLGIADEVSLLWGNIQGTIEEQEDLVRYIEQKWAYTSDVSEDINTVKEALDYALYFISRYKSNDEDIEELKIEIGNVKASIEVLRKELQEEIDSNKQGINNISLEIDKINERIQEINSSIENIDVDKNISNWIKKSLTNSKTIELKEDETLEVIISDQEDNAIQLLQQDISEEGEEPEYITLKGLYVKNLEPKITETQESIQKVQEDLELNIEQSTIYQTELSDDIESSVLQGTTVGSLKGKQFNEIIDALLFPTTVRDLIYPELYYSFTSQIVEVGTANLNPTLTFVKHDAGEETERVETIQYNEDIIPELITYDSIGIYKYTGRVSYAAGEYLIDNKGEQTEYRVEAGTIEANATVTATYPWYAGNTDSTSKQQLIPFGQESGVVTISLSGRAVIKLPGSKSKLTSFKVDGGLGYLDVDLTGWEESTEQLNDYTYKVWTKKDSYSSILSHQLNFTLIQ